MNRISVDPPVSPPRLPHHRQPARGFLAVVLIIAAALIGAACARTAAPSDAPGAGARATASPSVPIPIVAAENVYGDLARQIGGDRVAVTSILKDPTVDPHEYDSTVADAKAVAGARIVIKNGLGYDAFVDRLLAASPRPDRVVIDVGHLTGHRDGDNPHLWYDPATMPRVARSLADTLSRLDPSDAGYFARRLQEFQASEAAVDDRIAAIRARHAGTRVLATEPVLDYLTEALGLVIVDRDGAFQRAVEAGNDPPAAAVVAFREQITTRAVKVLIYNRQTVTPVTTQMLALARQTGIAVVPVSETEPEGMTYQQWMLDQLSRLDQALSSP
jgi:zinc/manganese transport system substrate-binding protein